MACKQNLDSRCVLISDPSTLGCWRQNTSQIQNKEVYATLCSQAMSYSVGNNSASCRPWTVCDTGFFAKGTPSPYFDRTCVQCGAGTYTSTTNAVQCLVQPDCPAGHYVTAEAAPSHARNCSACAPGTFSTVANADKCMPAVVCMSGSFESRSASRTADRICSPCPSGTYSSASSSSSSSFGARAVGQASPNATGPLPQPERTAEAFGATQKPLACRPKTVCQPGSYARFDALGSGSAQDQKCEPCRHGTYASAANAVECLPWRNCSDAYQ